MKYYIVEKDNPIVIHGIFDTLENAQRHLKMNIPFYCRRGFFMDKTLTPESFTITGRM
jgi:hypothetical protein